MFKTLSNPVYDSPALNKEDIFYDLRQQELKLSKSIYQDLAWDIDESQCYVSLVNEEGEELFSEDVLGALNELNLSEITEIVQKALSAERQLNRSDLDMWIEVKRDSVDNKPYLELFGFVVEVSEEGYSVSEAGRKRFFFPELEQLRIFAEGFARQYQVKQA